MIALPEPPKVAKQKVKTATGQLDVTLYSVEIDRSSAYVVTFSDLPENEIAKGSEDRRLDHARDGAISRARGKLKSEIKIEIAGNPGREIQIEGQNGLVLRVRIYAVGRRLYQVLAMGPAGFCQTKDTRLVLDSFRLNK